MSANPKSKNFSSNTKGLSSPASLHQAVAASTQVLWSPASPAPRSIRCDAAGVVVLKDAEGTSATYNVLQSEILPVQSFTELEATTNIAVQLWW
jgi:hypothetical protein